MAARLPHEITRDGQVLLVTESRRCELSNATRDDPYAAPYSDAISREIQFERQTIIEKLAPFLIAKVS
jgi:hypothetical protein